MRKYHFISLTSIAVTLFLSSCATFQAKKKVNLAPFAENAVSIVGEIEYGLSKARAIHVRPFIGGPASITYENQWKKLVRFLRGIVAYSVQVVTISQSSMSDEQKAEALSDYIADLSVPVINDPKLDFRISKDEFKTMIKNIRNQDDYLAAMNAAQPVIDEMARLAELVIEDLKEAQNAARSEVVTKIEEYHAPVLKFRDSYKDWQGRTIQIADYLTRWGLGEKEVEDSLLILDPTLKKYLQTGKPMTNEISGKIGKEVIERLQAGNVIQAQLLPEFEQYQKEMRELDELISIADRGTKQSKAAINIWRRSHQIMAAGITEPAAIDLFGIAKAAVKTVAPIP